jgi:hypothetical protein
VAIALVNQAAIGSAAATLSQAVTITSSTAGNCLVAVIAVGSQTAALTSVVDSTSTTWTVASTGYNSGTNTRIEIWYRTNVPAGITTVTANKAATSRLVLNVSEWSGVATTTPVDVASGSNTGVGNASGTAHVGPSQTTTNAEDVVIQGISYPSAATVSSVGGGFAAQMTSAASSTSQTLQAQYRLPVATGTYQATWTLSAAIASGYAGIALKAAAGATPIPPILVMQTRRAY